MLFTTSHWTLHDSLASFLRATSGRPVVHEGVETQMRRQDMPRGLSGEIPSSASLLEGGLGVALMLRRGWGGSEVTAGDPDTPELYTFEWEPR